MAAVSLSSRAAVLLLLVTVLVARTAVVQAQLQACANELTALNVCAPFVVPGAPNTVPSAECCGALQGVERDCICNTLRIASRLPSACNLQPVSCG
ncbi:protein MEN-8-like [Malania oleifera]|uniref:protein MEN-8-like n=1 Tax=Malania oleifera TaxID=397392 RepID=UPI0025AE1746|nr:protein MEN-8-like [Malania oleifera]